MGARPCLSATALKRIAVFAMTVDHVAWYFVPTASPLGQVMHAIGRLTAPIMCYFIAEGYHHTRSVGRYALRLGVFALASHFAFSFFNTGRWFDVSKTGMLFTLLVGLCAIAVYDSDLHEAVRLVLIPLLLLISEWGDWGFIAVAWCLIFHVYRDDPAHRDTMYAVFSLVIAAMSCGPQLSAGLFQFGTLLALPLLRLYNGQRGKHAFKLFFYLYYPLHLVAIPFLWRSINS